MDAARVGRAMRALRRRRGWRQADLASRAGVSASTVSRIESGGSRSMTLDVLQRVSAPLGMVLDLVPRWQGEGLDRLLDEAHASLVDALVRRYVAGGWEVAVEVSFAIDGERGSIDLLAFHAAASVLAVNEVKSVVPDAQASVHGLDRKARLAPRIAASRGWRARNVLRVFVVNDDRTSRRRIERHAALFDAAFPVRGHAAAAWIRDPASAVAALEGPRQGLRDAPRDAPRDVSRAVSALLFLPSVHRVNAGGARGGRHRVR